VAKPPERVSAKPILYSLTMDVLIIRRQWLNHYLQSAMFIK
jgi:hypothetical protein